MSASASSEDPSSDQGFQTGHTLNQGHSNCLNIQMASKRVSPHRIEIDVGGQCFTTSKSTIASSRLFAATFRRETQSEEKLTFIENPNASTSDSMDDHISVDESEQKVDGKGDLSLTPSGLIFEEAANHSLLKISEITPHCSLHDRSISMSPASSMSPAPEPPFSFQMQTDDEEPNDRQNEEDEDINTIKRIVRLQNSRSTPWAPFAAALFHEKAGLVHTNSEWAEMHGVETEDRTQEQMVAECRERFGKFCERLTPDDHEWKSRLAALRQAFEQFEEFDETVKQMVDGQKVFHRLRLFAFYEDGVKYGGLLCWESDESQVIPRMELTGRQFQEPNSSRMARAEMERRKQSEISIFDQDCDINRDSVSYSPHDMLFAARYDI